MINESERFGLNWWNKIIKQTMKKKAFSTLNTSTIFFIDEMNQRSFMYELIVEFIFSTINRYAIFDFKYKARSIKYTNGMIVDGI